MTDPKIARKALEAWGLSQKMVDAVLDQIPPDELSHFMLQAEVAQDERFDKALSILVESENQ